MTIEHNDVVDPKIHNPRNFEGAATETALVKGSSDPTIPEYRALTELGATGPQGDPGPPGPGDADTVSMNEIATATFDNVQAVHNVTRSSGLLDGGGVLTSNGDGTAAITAAMGQIRAANDIASDLLQFNQGAIASLALIDLQTNYIYIEYNSGTPQYVATTTKRTDRNTNILISTLIRAGIELHIFNPSKFVVGDGIGRAVQRFIETERFERASGAVISETGTRNIAITAGAFWEGLNNFLTDALDTSVADVFEASYQDGSGGWTEILNQTQIDNLQYDDGSGTLATLSNNEYGVFWIFMETDGHGVGPNSAFAVIYGRDSYTLSNAQDAQVPANLPPRVVVHGKLVGKVIIQKSAVAFTSIESAFDTEFTGSTVTDHNSLINLQGGLSGERFHLSQVEIDTVNNIAISALAAVDIDMSGDKFKTKTITGNTVFTISNPKLGSVVQVRIDGNFTITLPATVKNALIGNDYNGGKINNLFIECIDAAAPLYLASILTED